MSTSPKTIPVSHKRTSSAAGNTAEEPQVKRQASDIANPAFTLKSKVSDADPHYVYVVMVDSNPQYTEPLSDIHAIYATIKDANNAVKGIVNSEYNGAEETKQGCEDDGRIYWSSDDAGEGERVEVYIRVLEVKPSGCEPEREWENGGVDDLGSGEDYGEERDSEEEDEGAE
ncbi:hypothetical protein N431DRAFT_478905 [Stipitochalara longipes BDJ]|nr:hypothetical protein N431DRAFT_478905 [Stipitochalara longipes BDJ]